MPVTVLEAGGDRPPREVVDAVVEALLRGGVVALPTDTVYGLAVDPGVPGATRRLFELKERPDTQPVAVLVASLDQARLLAHPVPAYASKLMATHWPGALTLVLPRRRGVGLELGPPPDTVGVRCPDDPLVRAVADRLGPLATTSANRHRHPTPETAGEIAALFGDRLALVVDGGARAGRASTVVDCTGSSPVVLREGEVRV
ncbi:MAG TPA: L-threonylcarbamoyladenylate synthase [Acidimicrobiales bacterium]